MTDFLLKWYALFRRQEPPKATALRAVVLALLPVNVLMMAISASLLGPGWHGPLKYVVAVPPLVLVLAVTWWFAPRAERMAEEFSQRKRLAGASGWVTVAVVNAVAIAISLVVVLR